MEKLKKLSEIATLLFYIETTPFGFVSEKRIKLINKYRDKITKNFYFEKIVEPLVLRLYEHANKSKHCKRVPCAYKGTTFVFTIRGHAIYPILTMGSKEQLYEICKKECIICPTAVYTPAIIIALLELLAFETASLISKVKNRFSKDEL